MGNVIYNELRYRSYNVDVGIVETREYVNEVAERKQLEIDFVANLGSKNIIFNLPMTFQTKIR